MAKKKKNLTKKHLQELLDRETFTYNGGDDFGDGKVGTASQVSTKKTSDELATMTIQPPSTKLPSDYVRTGYIGEAKKIAEAILSKVNKEDNDVISKEDAGDAELVDKNAQHVRALKKSIKKVDFQLLDDKTKEELINQINHG